MQWDKLKRGLSIIRNEGYQGFLRILFKLSKNRDGAGKTLDALSLIGALDFSMEEFNRNRQLMSEFEKKMPEVKSINWFIPYFLHAYYGGIYTIFRFANYFAVDKGIRTRIVLYDNPYISEEEIRGRIRETFPKLAEQEIYIYPGPDVSVIPYADISIATLWTSAYLLMKFQNTKGKFYFIQDYEPLFYPAGSYYALTEATYRFGFRGIVNTPGLHEFVTRKHGMNARYFIPSIDRHVFFAENRTEKDPKAKKRLFFYGRPQHERNAFELALATVKKIKVMLGEQIEILSAGSDWDTRDYGVDGIVNNLGLLGYHETAELYRTCDFGLILMFTKHPSYLPMELMACGAITISNYNNANTWLLKDRVNCIVVEPSPTYITDRLLSLMKDPALCERIKENAFQTVAQSDWNREMEKIYRFIIGTDG
jgi:glycosyltransferase involved in cell wall biosynthesis